MLHELTQPVIPKRRVGEEAQAITSRSVKGTRWGAVKLSLRLLRRAGSGGRPQSHPRAQTPSYKSRRTRDPSNSYCERAIPRDVVIL